MNLTTPVKIPQTPVIEHDSSFLLLGSCFAVNIGKKLLENRFEGCVNPFGIAFNPLSIANSLQRLMFGKEFNENELFKHNGLYHSLLHHGDFSCATQTATLQKINSEFNKAKELLQKLDFLILTFGSSWVYLQNGQVAANCHKLPETEFERKRLSISEIVIVYKQLFEQLFAPNSELKIILSVSPIRYLREGAVENSTNKATLLLAVEQLTQIFPQIYYFPACEILLDELRDYRFYAEDLLHPSDLTQKIIWQRFADCYFTDEAKQKTAKIEKLNKMLAHRPIHTDTAEYQQFIKKIEQIENELK